MRRSFFRPVQCRCTVDDFACILAALKSCEYYFTGCSARSFARWKFLVVLSVLIFSTTVVICLPVSLLPFSAVKITFTEVIFSISVIMRDHCIGLSCVG